MAKTTLNRPSNRKSIYQKPGSYLNTFIHGPQVNAHEPLIVLHPTLTYCPVMGAQYSLQKINYVR